MPSQFVIVPATLSPRYQGVEDPTTRQSRLKFLIIASVFIFSIAIAIYCIVGLIYSSQPHFLPATLAVGTGVSVLVIGSILAFLKCWSRVRGRMPAVIPGNSTHGFELPNDEDASNTGGGDEGLGSMSSEERSRNSTPIYISKGRMRQGSVNKENPKTTWTAGASSNSRVEAVPKTRAASRDVPFPRAVGGQCAFAACDQVRKSANQKATTHHDEAPENRANLPSEARRHLISMPLRGAYSGSSNLPKYYPLQIRHEPVSGSSPGAGSSP
ncbi:predicted protein [Verticillium alfalfae VaMs.102]|uniref:Predicted protein n=1 Tax=Verticillium alfalfae (strain VaMs.102 / ATCC MYA-4576 / FGSC 10136) TaxID=526221 RepID=C9SEP1_VERA1|nr:predicted protein [Verticillium alfalfae VaMs.102]EEY16634.1 predicted protein [Verticillium alfalfae VaMs.102]